jgi:hypothetical protein
MRHVGLPVFAVVLCRKFASATVFSWHFAWQYCITEMPQHLIAGNFAIAATWSERAQRPNQV